MTVADHRVAWWRIVPWIVAAALLLMPLVAMRFTADVAWDGTDFLVFGAMLIVACSAFELAVRLTRRNGARLLAGGAIAGLFLLVWAQLAVGTF